MHEGRERADTYESLGNGPLFEDIIDDRILNGQYRGMRSWLKSYHAIDALPDVTMDDLWQVVLERACTLGNWKFTILAAREGDVDVQKGLCIAAANGKFVAFDRLAKHVRQTVTDVARRRKILNADVFLLEVIAARKSDSENQKGRPLSLDHLRKFTDLGATEACRIEALKLLVASLDDYICNCACTGGTEWCNKVIDGYQKGIVYFLRMNTPFDAELLERVLDMSDPLLSKEIMDRVPEDWEYNAEVGSKVFRVLHGDEPHQVPQTQTKPTTRRSKSPFWCR